MDQIPYITSINTGDADGNGYLILKSENCWKNRLVRPGKWDSKKVQWLIFNRKLEFQKKQMQDSDYDPRRRPWYELAINAKDLTVPVWTQPYLFYTTKEPGITVAIQVFQPNQNSFILAFDMLHKDLTSFTTGFKPSPNGKIFIMLDNEKVTALPSGDKFTAANAIEKYLFKDVRDLEIEEISSAVELWKKSGKPDGGNFKVSSGGNTWWCAFSKLTRSKRNDNPSWICTLIPSSDILGNVTLQFLLILAISAIASIIATIMALILSRRFTKPIHGLVQQVQSLRQLDVRQQSKPETSIREIHHLTEANERMRIALDAFSRYIPIDIVRQLLDRGDAAKIGGKASDVTILFTDIQGFTTISEKMSPMQLTSHLEEYFNLMFKELSKENATVDKFIGDAVMAFWGAPLDNPKHVLSAVRAAWNCLNKLDDLNKMWKVSGKPEFVTRFGISTGEAVVGNVGASSRLNYTVLGDNVNLASRMEELNKYYGTRILVTSSVVSQTDDLFMFRHVDRGAVKGKLQVEEIFELLGPIDQVPKDMRLYKELYEEAFSLYLKRDFSKAMSHLNMLKPSYQKEKSVIHLKEACIWFIKTPPDNDWKGDRIFNR
ncbi:adenylate cyclase, family 3 [Candidatus Scalindua japonica]|uniref:Adenylate cyclase, family 3 n=2 Tax=Candidatus Scalindua japonica TaxID=1284222 RepID=A0A286U198_9BACT|nr:adenylate cyclase, family 3 [Candidatus Scalindua japonica]